MSHLSDQQLEENLYEQFIEDLEKKYYGGINKVLGEPWFTKSDQEIEEEASKLVKQIVNEIGA